MLGLFLTGNPRKNLMLYINNMKDLDQKLDEIESAQMTLPPYEGLTWVVRETDPRLNLRYALKNSIMSVNKLVSPKSVEWCLKEFSRAKYIPIRMVPKRMLRWIDMRTLGIAVNTGRLVSDYPNP